VSPMERVELRPGYEISRVIRGGWQLAGGHGPVDRLAVKAELQAFCEAGIFTFDCADIYTGVEDLIGEFRVDVLQRKGVDALNQIKIHTKYVPDLDKLPYLKKADVRSGIDRSLRRLRAERLDLVQFHWWDYALPGCIEVALWLKELQQQGKINLLGVTNFDTKHTKALLEAGVPLVSTQVQYSLLDARPENGLVELCRRNNVHLLCYGTVAGGFLTDAWMGSAEPRPPFENRSLTKYKLVIDEFGGWDLFQELLQVLRVIAHRHGVDIATVASRAVLARKQVAGVIVGARSSQHLSANVAITKLDLASTDYTEINDVLAQRRGPRGDVFGLERDPTGPHGTIMKYNLNRHAS
jgi:aryl-alcohol dehydrogenase-like predicted oxidoreductase